MDRRLELMEALISLEPRKNRAICILQELSNRERAIKEEISRLMNSGLLPSKPAESKKIKRNVVINREDMENTVISMLSTAIDKTLPAGDIMRALGLDKAGFQRLRKSFFSDAGINKIGGGRGVCYRLA